MTKKYRRIDELKVGDNCYIFTHLEPEGIKVKECKIVKIYREYSTWFKKECLVIEYLFDNNIKKDILQDEIIHTPWIAGPLCADKEFAIRDANKINKSYLKKYTKKYTNIENKYKQELEGLSHIIDDLNKFIEDNDNL